MGALISAVLGKIVGSAAFFGAVQAAMFVALKAVLTVLLFSGLAVVLHNFLISWITDYITAAADAYGNHADAGNLEQFVFQITGIGAYLGGLFKVQESFSVLMAGFSVGAVRSFIPFIGK